MSDTAFADATRPAPRRVLRLPMLPYSLGHEVLLTQQRNPLLLSESEFLLIPASEQCRAVIRASLICSRSWTENQKPNRWMKLWRWSIRRANFAAEIAEFRVYRREGSTFPVCKRPDDHDPLSELGSPFLARLTDYAFSRMGPEAFDAPFGMLCWCYYAERESQGACHVENALDKQIREEIAQHEADYQKEQEAKCRH